MLSFSEWNEDIESLCSDNQIAVINENINYWFVRSDGGSLFGEFILGNYIGILWNKILNMKEISEENEKELVQKYRVLYDDSKRPGNIFKYHDILINKMKAGDIVVVPSEDSRTFMIGSVSGDFYMNEPSVLDEIEKDFDKSSFVIKRRPVRWITNHPVKREAFDPILLNLVYCQHTIVDANKYSEFINRVIYPNSLYYRNGELHLVIGVYEKESIPAASISGIISPISEYCREISRATGVVFDDRSLGFQATVNSPGTIELVALLGTSPFIGAIAILGVMAIGVLLVGGKVSFSKHKHVETGGILKAISEFRANNANLAREKVLIEQLKENIKKIQPTSETVKDENDQG